MSYPSTTCLFLAGTLGALGALGGCQALNRSLGPGPEPLPIFARLAPGAPTGPEIQHDGPEGSLGAGHDRSHWTAVRIEVPVGRVESGASWSWPARRGGSARSRGVYPTAELAVQVDATGPEQWGEALLEIPAALVAPARMLLDPPGSVPRSPDVRYRRLPDRSAADPGRWY